MPPKTTGNKGSADKSIKDFLSDEGAESRLLAAIEASKKELKHEVSEIRRDLQAFSQKIEADIEQLKQENEEQHEALELETERVEWHQRKYNLVFKGIPEKELNEAGLKTFLTQTLEIEDAGTWLFQNVHKLPKGLLIARFVLWDNRQTTLSQARLKLKGTGKTVQTDLPNRLRMKRNDLLKKARDVREGGTQARVIEKGQDVVLQVRKDSKDVWVTQK